VIISGILKILLCLVVGAVLGCIVGTLLGMVDVYMDRLNQRLYRDEGWDD